MMDVVAAGTKAVSNGFFELALPVAIGTMASYILLSIAGAYFPKLRSYTQLAGIAIGAIVAIFAPGAFLKRVGVGIVAAGILSLLQPYLAQFGQAVVNLVMGVLPHGN